MADISIVINTGIKDHAFFILESFNNMRKDGNMCDFIIKVGKEELVVHRDILAASSKYFLAMFSHDTLEKKNGFVDMKEVSFSAVSKCVDYIYTGKLETSVKEVDDLLFVVNMMQLHAVAEKLSSLLQSCLVVDSFMQIRHVALKYGLNELSIKCDTFAIENLHFLIESRYLDLFEFEYVFRLLSSDLLYNYGYDDDVKLAAAMQWIKADIESRRTKLVPLCRILKLENVSQSYGRYLVETETFCGESAEFMAMMYPPVLNGGVKPVNPSLCRNADPVAFLSFHPNSGVARLFDPATQTNETVNIHAMPEPCKGKFCAVSVKTRLYALFHNKSVHVYDLKSFTWHALNEMMEDHGIHMRATAFNGVIYVCGSDKMEKYSIVSNEWEELNNNDVCMNDCELITYNNQVMTIGGAWPWAACGNRNGAISDVNILNTTNLAWSQFASLCSSRICPAATSFKGKIFVVGGYTKWPLRDAEYYDDASNLWSVLPAAIHAHVHFKLFSVRNVLYTVGGTSSEKYDITTKHWSNYPPLQNMGSGCDSVAISRYQLALLCNR